MVGRYLGNVISNPIVDVLKTPHIALFRETFNKKNISLIIIHMDVAALKRTGKLNARSFGFQNSRNRKILLLSSAGLWKQYFSINSINYGIVFYITPGIIKDFYNAILIKICKY